MKEVVKSGQENAHWSRIVLKSLNALDLSCSKKLAFCSESGFLRPIMLLLELSGHGVPWISGALFMAYRAVSRAEKEVFLNLLLALLVDLVVVGSMKLIFRRRRPVYNKSDMFLTVSVDHFSFPSGHATRAAMLAVFLLAHLRMRGFAKLLLVTWSVCVGTSRVVLGRHHVSDVVAGFTVGYLQYHWLVMNLWMTWDTFDYYVSQLFTETWT